MVIALATIALHRMAGGLERNIVALANFLADQGHRVVLVTFDRPNAETFYPLDKRVDWQCLGTTVPHGKIGFLDRLALIWRIRRVLVSAGVTAFICFHHGILLRCMLANCLRGTRVICSERNSLTMYDYIGSPKWNLNFLLMFFADAITVQFPSYVRQYPSLLRKRVHVIHNPVRPVPVEPGRRRPNVLSIGRHVAQKRFDLLVRAFHLATERYPEWTMTIIGDGPLKDSLQRTIDELGLHHRINLLPATPDLQSYFAEATLYCQPSQWEGFPNAQAEAMAAGVIPVGLAATSGVSDLIEDGVSGIVVQGPASADTLAAGLKAIIGQPDLWPAMSRQAAQVSNIYSTTSWGGKWSQLLDTPPRATTQVQHDT